MSNTVYMSRTPTGDDDWYKKMYYQQLKRIKELEDRVAHDSWITNPDRSGGAFSQDEIDNYNSWK